MKQASRPLDGEDIGTTRWEDARHWISIYADLLEFKRGILDRIERDLTKLAPIARRAAEADVKIIESQMVGYQKRLELWYRRVWELAGLWLDREGRVIHYNDREGTLTIREFQLLDSYLVIPTDISLWPRSSVRPGGSLTSLRKRSVTTCGVSAR